MNNLIKNYISKLTKEQVTSFALMNNIVLSEDELNFTYSFIKKHGEEVIKDYNNFDIDQYQNYYTKDNFVKIKKLFKEYSEKFKPFLNLHKKNTFKYLYPMRNKNIASC